MRELTDVELQSLQEQGRCPFCGSKRFYRGPQGGLATNWYCAFERCGAGFNLLPPNIPLGGQLIREPQWLAGITPPE